MQTTTIYLVRHADVHNPNNVYYGRIGRFRLSDLGLEQAAGTALALAGEPIRAIYSSPQLRARQTAKALASHHPGVSPQVSQLLAEVRSAWQGRPFTDLDAIGYNFYAQPMHESDESMEAVWVRVQRFVERCRRRHAGQHCVGVSHGDPVILARTGYLGLPIQIESIRKQPNYPGKGSLTRFIFGPDLKETYPISVEYYDPNGDNPQWSQGWVRLSAE